MFNLQSYLSIHNLSLFSIFIPIILNIIVHFTCEYFYCNHWYNLFGHNMICNTCIDTKKILKDHQISIYVSIGTYLLLKVNTIIYKFDKTNKTVN